MSPKFVVDHLYLQSSSTRIAKRKALVFIKKDRWKNIYIFVQIVCHTIVGRDCWLMSADDMVAIICDFLEEAVFEQSVEASHDVVWNKSKRKELEDNGQCDKIRDRPKYRRTYSDPHERLAFSLVYSCKTLYFFIMILF